MCYTIYILSNSISGGVSMIPYSKFVQIYQELVNCLEVVEKQLNKVLDYDKELGNDVIVDFGVDDEKDFTIVYFDYHKGCNQKATVGEKDYPKMLEISSKEDLLSFLGDRILN